MEKPNPYLDKLNSWSSHRKIAAMLDGLPKNTRILDVGVGTGILARLCVGREYIIRGIEPNPKWLGDTRNLYADIYTGILEQTPDSYLEGHSVVVCGDVLEHLIQPVEQLQRLVELQPIGCLYIISVPNVANVWVRLNLLLGHFDYSDRGILDRTHLHFFTRKTFLFLLQSAGLEVKEIQATPIPLELVTPFFAQNPIGQGLYAILARGTLVWPTVLGYQWVAMACKVKQ